MKKNVLRIFATASAVVALALIIVLLVTTFGGISVDDYNNALVKGLLTSMGIVYIMLTTVTIVMLFVTDEFTKEITLRAGQEGNTRITVGVIKKIAKEKSALIPGIKCKKCAIITNEYGVRLKLTISVKGKDAEEAEDELRAILIDAYDKILGFKFHSIELKVSKLVPAYTTDVAKVLDEAKAAPVSAETPAEEPVAAAEEVVEVKEEPVEEAASEEAVEEAELVEEVIEEEQPEEKTEEAESVEETAVVEEPVAVEEEKEKEENSEDKE